MDSYDRYIANLSRSRKPAADSQWLVKALALVFLLLCVAIGLAGIILPLIPGLLFLALAVIVAARMFPALEQRLRQSPMFNPYMEKTDQFWRMSRQGKVKFACWLTLRILWDACVLLVGYAGKFVAWLRKDSGGF